MRGAIEQANAIVLFQASYRLGHPRGCGSRFDSRPGKTTGFHDFDKQYQVIQVFHISGPLSHSGVSAASLKETIVDKMEIYY